MEEFLHDQYELLCKFYPGWTLTEIRGLSVRQRYNWMVRATRKR